MLEEIRELYDYNRWANQRMLDAVERLSEEQYRREIPSSFPSVEKTLLHMVGAEWAWLRRWHGELPKSFPDFGLHDLARLRAKWQEIDRERDAFLASLDDEALRRIVSTRTFAGVPFETPLWQMLRHVVNHASYHRGQITTLLRQLGADPVATDLIAFYRDAAQRA